MVAAVFSLITAAARRLPRPWVELLVGRVLLRGLWLRLPAVRRLALANYRRVLAHGGREPAPEQVEAALDESVGHYARFMVAMLARPEDVEFARSRVDVSALWSAVERARARGRGAILAFSNFGLIPYAVMALLDRGLPLRVPILNRRTVAHWPHGWSDAFLSVGGSSRECLRALRANGAVAVVTMGNYLARRPSFELFGAPARLGYAAGRLAQASGAPIIPAFTLWEERGGRPLPGSCRVLVEPPIGPGEDAARLTEELTRCQERVIARYPGQWLLYEDLWDLRAMDENYRFVRWMLDTF